MRTGAEPGQAVGLRLWGARGNCHRRESAESGLAAAGTAPALLHLPRPREGQTHRPRFGQLRCRKRVLTAFSAEQEQGFSRPYTLK